jgi:hypothetical protein
MIPPYPYPYYTHASTSYMNSLALTWSKYGPRRPPKDKVAATTVSMAALFAGHQIGTKNGPYYGENIDTPAKL